MSTKTTVLAKLGVVQTALASLAVEINALSDVAPTPVPTPPPIPTPTPVPPTPIPGPVPTGPSVPGTWRLVFSDEFTGTSLDTSKWSTGWFGSGITKPVNSSETAAHDPVNVTVTLNNALAMGLTSGPVTVGNTTYKYRGSLISTNGKFSFSHGVVEARILFPAGSNGQLVNWPALWTDGQSWPGDGEIDIAEVLGTSMSCHFHTPAGGPGFNVVGNWAGSWHTYAVVWTPGKTVYYYDGNNVGTLSGTESGNPNYLILNHSASGSNATVPAIMLVDYVRVYQ
jgi:beta-glucanase (GH16 family)